MRTSTVSITPSSFARSLAALTIALASGLAGAGQVFAASASPAVSMSATTEGPRGAVAVAKDWNVDYPSQIGPEGPASTGIRSAIRPIAADTAQENTDVAQQAAER